MIFSTLITLSVILTLFFSALLLASQLIRRRMRATAAGIDVKTHRLLDDLKPLEDALVDFFASSNVSSAILRVLATHRTPISFKVLVHEARAAEERRGTHEDMPMGAIRAVLTILQLARLARMTRAGFSITELGREVYRRMRPEPLATAAPPMDRVVTRTEAHPNRHRRRAVLPPRPRLVLSELHERARTLVHR